MPLYSIEGIDGTGKSTLVAALGFELERRGVDALVLREPGGVETAERIRELVKDPGLAVSDRTEALLYAAARAQLIEERVRPALKAGRTVLLDRFVDSSLAYQGGGRELGVDAIGALNRFATGGLVPDRTLLLSLDPDVAAARAVSRGEAPDRLEQAGSEFYARVAEAYARLAAAEPDRIRVLDASGTPQQLLAAALTALDIRAGDPDGTPTRRR
ncbi:MAG: dTMP kinase [Solirubrobacterales bacterium]|nr:dTMP kinase [Solirubrobacterales bacterium]